MCMTHQRSVKVSAVIGVTVVLTTARQMKHPLSTAAPDENIFGDGVCQEASDQSPALRVVLPDGIAA